MAKKNYDFAGWVTKSDIVCSDGVVIKHDAFKDNDQAKVPLIWNHDHSTPDNVIGHMILHNMNGGVYGYGHLNNSDQAAAAKESLEHGDIVSMSIGANKIKRQGRNVIHGNIFEVSLVLAGANPEASIEEVITHSGEVDEDKVIIYPHNLIHAESDVPSDTTTENTPPEENEKEKTVGEVLETLSEEQAEAVELLVSDLLAEKEEVDEKPEENSDEENTNPGGTDMKHNVFDKTATNEEGVLIHSQLNDVLMQAISSEASSLQAAIAASEIDLQHGITGIETLFPEAHNLDPEPRIFRDENTKAAAIVDGTKKSPFARIKIRGAKLTEDEARARGYIKGKEKLEQVFGLYERETTPQTIYKKQQLDRDDIIDITDFDVVAFINKEMRIMLMEELGRAILVGDGRATSDESKIKEDKIRPIISDDDFYTLKKTFTSEETIFEDVILGMLDYKGSGSPQAWIDPTLLAKVRLLKGTDGRWLNGHIMTEGEVAAALGVSSMQPTTLMADKGMVIVNLSDYTVGSTKGGEVTTFEDFDIDFNQHKYLIETRVSGALTVPHGAVYFKQAEAPSGQSAQTQSAPLNVNKN